MSNRDARAAGFGISWTENAVDFLQTFGYRTASKEEMERLDLVEDRADKGYYYICYMGSSIL